MIRTRGRRGIRYGRCLAGQDFNRAIVVRRHRVMQGADKREAPALLRQPGKQFADVNTRGSRANWPKRSAILARCVRLEVEGLELTWAAPHPEENDRSRR